MTQFQCSWHYTPLPDDMQCPRCVADRRSSRSRAIRAIVARDWALAVNLFFDEPETTDYVGGDPTWRLIVREIATLPTPEQIVDGAPG